tara:strand:+ start:958 stop:1437 length:480 start_codon:yes stop_codon:yes gene_type:complete
MITKRISLPITNIGKNLKATFEKYLQYHMEGKCIKEGFVKHGSCRIITFSSGQIDQGSYVVFQVVFECLVCFPVEGMLIECVAKHITKAGIRAESGHETPSPFILFVARDHNYAEQHFSKIQVEETFTARVIGQRFELNDSYISIIAEIIKPKNDLKYK